MPCAVCAVRLLLRGVTPSRAADVELAPSCRLFDTSMGHNHEEAQSRITSSSAASSNARCSGKRAAAQQRSRHSRIVFIIPAAGEIEGPTQKTRQSHPCLISRRGTWDFGWRAAPLACGEFLKSDSEEQQSRCCLSGQCRASIRCFRHHTTHSLWGRGALSAAPAPPPLGPWSVWYRTAPGFLRAKAGILRALFLQTLKPA